EQFEATAQSGNSRVIASGGVDATSLTLSRLDFAQENKSRLTLAEPAVLHWKPRLQIETLHLAGPEADVNASTALGDAGRIQLSVRGFSSVWLTDIVPVPGPAWQVNSLALMGTWDRGPMVFSITAGA